jgi:hypothetical protein
VSSAHSMSETGFHKCQLSVQRDLTSSTLLLTVHQPVYELPLCTCIVVTFAQEACDEVHVYIAQPVCYALRCHCISCYCNQTARCRPVVLHKHTAQRQLRSPKTCATALLANAMKLLHMHARLLSLHRTYCQLCANSATTLYHTV